MNSPVLLGVAAAAEHPLIDLDSTAFLQLAIFIAMSLLATRFLFRPYLQMRDERAAGMEGARREAEALSAEADAKLADYEAKLAAARSRAASERQKIRTEAAEHQREVTEGARSKATAALEEAHARVLAETESARSQLLPRADALAGDMVARLLGRKVD